jgi:predicted kinase
MNRPQLYLFVGYPGAGKTTISQALRELTGAVHIWADRERIAMFGEPTHSQAENKQLYERLNQETEKLLDEGKSVIFDTNFNFYKDREYLREEAAKRGADTTVVWVTTPLELAKKRAVEESHGQATRLYGNMESENFDRIASHLEPPRESEKVLKLDGTNFDKQALMRLLGS